MHFCTDTLCNHLLTLCPILIIVFTIAVNIPTCLNSSVVSDLAGGCMGMVFLYLKKYHRLASIAKPASFTVTLPTCLFQQDVNARISPQNTGAKPHPLSQHKDTRF